MEVVGVYQGQKVVRYVLQTATGYQLVVLNYGATIVKFLTPDKDGKFKNIIVASEDVAEYFDNAPKWGAAIGPVAGRIAGGKVTIDGKDYQLEQNLLGHHLHSGSIGFSETVFKVSDLQENSITFYSEKADRIGNYPGNLKTWISYTLSDTGALTIDYKITTDKATIVNPTNHSYFNLTGDFRTTILDHKLQLATKALAAIDQTGVPTGELVKDSAALELIRRGIKISELFQEEPFKTAGGIDHPFVLNDTATIKVVLSEATTGRTLSVTTTSPAMVIYTSNGYDNKTSLNAEKPIVHNGIALETQILPDAIHHEGFGDIILAAGKTFRSQTIYQAGLLQE
ncbi:aldose 1-epimerase [Granulicatella balaenopterae]|uniref:Aldose 1-epimerase n=1 Tax=Granulicatella balaenopterae TaxID=137733 RepID=A0A1H9JMC1_9LACT|nr:aldose epimerase family protein [Granulicatella balaenopterae]SEQ87929.1 aldose 1-epimerase [Granulicatella balaenopterae]